MIYNETGTSPKESCYWHFRTNNLSSDYYAFLTTLITTDEKVDWIIVGAVETGEVEKGEHFHVCIKMERSVRKVYMKKLLNITKNFGYSYYLEAKYTNANVKSFVKYVIKDGIRFSSENGSALLDSFDEKKKEEEEKEDVEIKNKNSKELYKLRIQKGKANDWEWFQENDPKWTLSAEYSKLYAKYFRAGADTNIKPITGKLKHWWIFGNSGAGKSSSIEYLYPDRYKKIMTNEKWDGYDPHFEGHQIVHIDELNSFKSLEKGMEGLDGLKNKVDRNPFAVRKNYGTDIINIRPQSFIITSNYTPSQLLSKVEERGFNVEMEASCLTRKFRVIHVEEWLRINRLKCIPDIGIFDMTVAEDVERYNMCIQDNWVDPEPEDDFIR